MDYCYRFRHNSQGVNTTKMENLKREAFQFDGNNQGPHHFSQILIIDCQKSKLIEFGVSKLSVVKYSTSTIQLKWRGR